MADKAVTREALAFKSVDELKWFLQPENKDALDLRLKHALEFVVAEENEGLTAIKDASDFLNEKDIAQKSNGDAALVAAISADIGAKTLEECDYAEPIVPPRPRIDQRTLLRRIKDGFFEIRSVNEGRYTTKCLEMTSEELRSVTTGKFDGGAWVSYYAPHYSEFRYPEIDELFRRLHTDAPVGYNNFVLWRKECEDLCMYYMRYATMPGYGL